MTNLIMLLVFCMCILWMIIIPTILMSRYVQVNAKFKHNYFIVNKENLELQSQTNLSNNEIEKHKYLMHLIILVLFSILALCVGSCAIHLLALMMALDIFILVGGAILISKIIDVDNSVLHQVTLHGGKIK